MDNQNSEFESQDNTSLVSVKKPNKLKIFGLVLLITTLLACSITFIYLWNKEKENVSKINNELNSIKTNTGELGQQETINSNVSAVKEQTSQTTRYKAKVGKYTLTLPSNYGIVNEHDGGGEGGETTKLLIGKNDRPYGVITSDSYGRVEIYSVGPSSNLGSLENYIKERNADNEPVSQLADIKIDGVAAKVYSLSGLFSIKEIHFSKNNAYHTITVSNDQYEGATQDLEAVIKGIKFD